MKYFTDLFHLTVFAMTICAMAMVVYCIGAEKDLLAVYWSAVAVFALRFVLAHPEPD